MLGRLLRYGAQRGPPLVLHLQPIRLSAQQLTPSRPVMLAVGVDQDLGVALVHPDFPVPTRSRRGHVRAVNLVAAVSAGERAVLIGSDHDLVVDTVLTA